MGDQVIITEDEDKPKTPDVIVVKQPAPEKIDKVVIEKTTVVEEKKTG
jgi:hypothetical protein